jgi:hypothetical protein
LVLHIRFILVLGTFCFVGFARAASFDPYFDLSVLGDLYPTSTANDLNNGQLHGRFKLLSQQENTKTYLDLGAGGLLGKQAENYFILPQAYVSFQKSDQFELTVGRIVKNYSHLDTYWMLGELQPLFRWDAARPEIQGLPGIFATYKPTQQVQIDFFASYLFLPTQGPTFSVVDGKLTSGNPWFSRPVDVIALSGAPFDLIYSVKTPDVSEIILKPAGGVSVFLQSEDEKTWARIGYFLKQRNEVVTPFEGTLNLGTNTGDIEIYPRTADHTIANLDVGYQDDDWGVTLSALSESNVEFETEPLWIYPIYSDQYKIGLNFLYHLTSFHSLEFGALRTFNNRVGVGGGPSGIEDSVDIFSFRNQYENAVDLRLTSVFLPQKQGFLFKSKARVAYDYKAQTALASFEVIYSPIADGSLFVRADLFGGERLTNEVYNNLLVNYLNRDRIQTGVKYVF